MTEDFLQGCCIYLCVFKQLPSECVMQCNSHCRCQHLLFCSILYPKGKYLNLKLPNVSAVQHIVVVFLLLRGTVLIGALILWVYHHVLVVFRFMKCISNRQMLISAALMQVAYEALELQSSKSHIWPHQLFVIWSRFSLVKKFICNRNGLTHSRFVAEH